MVVESDYVRLENKLYYAAFVLMLEGNKKMSAIGICQKARDKFPSLLKWADKQTLSIILSRCKSPDLFTISRHIGKPNTYALTPEFYGMLSDTVISETAGLSEMNGALHSSEDGVMLLYERVKNNGYRQPTMYSVFRQARDALRQTGAH